MKTLFTLLLAGLACAAAAQDTCATAIPVAGSDLPYTLNFDLTATTDTIDLSGANTPDVWLAFTADVDGTYYFSAVGGDTLATYVEGCGGAQRVGPDDDALAGNSERFTFPLSAGSTVWLVAEKYPGEGEFIDLSLGLLNPPANDTCTSATIVADGDLPFAETVSFIGATESSFSQRYSGPDVWYAFNPSVTDTYTITAESEDFDLTLEMIDACGGTSLQNQDADNLGYRSESMDFAATGGSSYVLVVKGTPMFGGPEERRSPVRQVLAPGDVTVTFSVPADVSDWKLLND